MNCFFYSITLKRIFSFYFSYYYNLPISLTYYNQYICMVLIVLYCYFIVNSKDLLPLLNSCNSMSPILYITFWYVSWILAICHRLLSATDSRENYLRILISHSCCLCMFLYIMYYYLPTYLLTVSLTGTIF